MVEKIQIISRICFRAIVIILLILEMDNKAIWSIPFGIIVALLTEVESLTK